MFFFFTREEYTIMQHEAWNSIIPALDVVRKRYPNMTVGMLHTILHIAKNQPAFEKDKTDMKTLAIRLEMPYSTFVRQTDILGGGVGGGGGLGLVEKQLIGSSQKIKMVDFTEKGVGLLNSIWEVLPTERIPSSKNGV